MVGKKGGVEKRKGEKVGKGEEWRKGDKVEKGEE